MPARRTCHTIMHSSKAMVAAEIFTSGRVDLRCSNRDVKKSTRKALPPI